MEQVLIVREVVVRFFKRFEVFILPLLKFFLGLFIFSRIASIGAVHGTLADLTQDVNPTMLNWLFALLFTIMPMNMSWLLIILTITFQFSANVEAALIIFLFLMFIFLFYARMAQKESILIIFTILAFHFNVPYLVPIIVGLYFPITAIIPVTIGIFVNAQIPVMFSLAATTTPVMPAEGDFVDTITALPDAFNELFTAVTNSISGAQDWLFMAVIFSAVIVLVHFISRIAIDFAREIAVGLGCVMIIFGFVISQIMVDGSPEIGIGSVILGTILCGIIALLIQFFDAVLDYQRTESVQFQDDNNYYNVRIVPKITMNKPQRVVKRIRPEDLPPDINDEDEDE